MESGIAIALGTVISWIVLLLVIPFARKLADFSMPPWPETLWKLAVVALSVNVIAVALDPVNVWLSWIVSAAAFWTLMVKWFDVDFFGALIIVMVSWVVRIFLVGLLMGVVSAML